MGIIGYSQRCGKIATPLALEPYLAPTPSRTAGMVLIRILRSRRTHLRPGWRRTAGWNRLECQRTNARLIQGCASLVAREGTLPIRQAQGRRHLTPGSLGDHPFRIRYQPAFLRGLGCGCAGGWEGVAAGGVATGGL